MEISQENINRYERNILLEDIGLTGQERLLKSSVLVIGAGGLGSSALFYLAAAGVGRIGIADFDNVDISNLQRQIIHNTSSIGSSKSNSAKDALLALNPLIEIVTINEKLCESNVDIITQSYDFVLDCTDNIESKFLINDCCVINEKPFSHAAVIGMIGQAMTYVPGNQGIKTSCYRCVIPFLPQNAAPPKGSEKGVLGTVCGLIGCIQANEAIKFIVGYGVLLTNRMLIYDASECRFSEIAISINPDCCFHVDSGCS